MVVDESVCRGLLAEEAVKLGRLGTSLGVDVKDSEEALRCLLVSGDLRGVLLVDIGLAAGMGLGGVVMSRALLEGLAARAGVAWGRGLGLGVSFWLPWFCFARSTIACTRADTGTGDPSPRFPIPTTSATSYSSYANQICGAMQQPRTAGLGLFRALSETCGSRRAICLGFWV